VDKKQKFLIQLGKQIKKVRLRKNMSQSDLAKASFKDRQSIERVENGKINPTIFYLNELAIAIGVSLSELVDLDDLLKKENKKSQNP
jgi:transcriptional regulator with XRE-family HTH domain